MRPKKDVDGNYDKKELDIYINDLEEIMHTAQGILTALNIGKIDKESLIHLDLRKKMIRFRETHK